jgi:ABC-type multidrug transport system fused ATPase/permease subunit
LEFAKPLKINDASINFNNVNFSYEENEGPTLQSINLKFEGWEK